MGLSPLNKGKKLELFDLHDHTEYWEYLCYYDIEYGRCDGLICFTKNMYSAISEAIDDWPDQLLISTMKVKKKLYELTDKLYALHEGYGNQMIDIKHLLF